MNFTREPIIETIISAKDGYKLSIKSSKSPQGEEYLVEAVEVVSFGGSFFYRCQEKPKTFFIPASDFEILEVKETRILIKNPGIEKSIKIAGGKEASKSVQKEEEVAIAAQEVAPKAQDQKRDKKRTRRGKSSKLEQSAVKSPAVSTPASVPVEPPVKPTVFSHLLTPPPGLISENLERYKQMTGEVPATLVLEQDQENKNLVQQEIEPELTDRVDALVEVIPEEESK